MTFIDFHTHLPTAEGVVTPRSFGIHPWHADQETDCDFESFSLRHLASFQDVDLVGECGLDKLRGPDLERQEEIFCWQLRIAEMLHKPVVVHCVRAFNNLLAIRKNYQSSQWIVHGFRGSLQLARQLYDAGILLSFGAALLDSKNIKLVETFRSLDIPFLLETDTAPCGIEAVYHAASAIRSTPISTLATQIITTYNTIIDLKSER